MGKSLAEFRKASDDFKRTWEREVALESARAEGNEQSIMNDDSASTTPYENSTEYQPGLEPAPPVESIARNSSYPPAANTTEANASESSQPEPMRKHDWL